MENEEFRQAQSRLNEATMELGRAMAPLAQEVAQQKADEEGVGIEEVFVMASPTGEMVAGLLHDDC